MLKAATCAAVLLATGNGPASVLANLAVATRRSSDPQAIGVGPPAGPTNLQGTSTDEGITATNVATTRNGSSVAAAATGGVMSGTSNYVLSRAIKFWHAVAVRAQLEDYSHLGVRPEQNGPCYTSRMSAMIHIAIYDAYVGASGEADTYLSYPSLPTPRQAGGGAGAGRRLMTWGVPGGAWSTPGLAGRTPVFNWRWGGGWGGGWLSNSVGDYGWKHDGNRGGAPPRWPPLPPSHGGNSLAAEFVKLRVAYAAIGRAAYVVIAHGYPSQKASLQATLDQYLGAFFATPDGVAWGSTVGQAVIADRASDGSDAGPAFVPFPEGKKYEMYEHQPDPSVSPQQPQYAPHWGDVKPFAFGDMDASLMRLPSPMQQDYPGDFEETKADGAEVSSTRTQEETNIGLIWAYDGAYKIGTPIRLYNEVVDAMVKSAEESGRYQTATGSALALAKLYSSVNVAMADAAIECWREKYRHNFWRPVIGIRWGDNDTFASTEGDPEWTPLGSPLTNTEVMSFTPAFPSYPSGHATIGTAAMMTAKQLLGLPDSFEFTWVSSEMDGVARNEDGTRRPHIESRMTCADAVEQNKASRVYLGVHWHFDCVLGAALGQDIADKLVAQFPARA